MNSYLNVSVKSFFVIFLRTMSLFFFTLFFMNNAVAVAVNINVGVTLQAATCDVRGEDGGDTITVDFKTITKKGIENQEYKSAIPFKITCSNDSPSLTLTLLGDVADFDSSLLKSTNNKDLGFEFQLNNKKMGLRSTSSNFTIQTIPILEVLPKLDPKIANPTAGAFNSASVKLVLDYQ